MIMKKTISILGLPLLAIATMPLAHAEVQGVVPLLKQARYWQSKGRGDLARQAYNRVLAIDPANAEARRGLAGNAPQPKAAAKPRAEQAARPAAPAPARAAPSGPARTARSDRGSDARAAGFRALEAGQLDTAAARFRTALSANPNDADALGGMGIVRLRKSEFAQARDLLARASRTGGAGKWAEALQSARFYADLDSARTALDKGDLARAEQLATTLTQSNVRDKGPAISVLASVYERQGRYNEAAELYRQLGKSGAAGSGAAIAQASATRNEARAALDSGDAARAEQLLRAAMGSAPDDPWVAYDLAGLLQQQGRVAEQDALVRQLSYSDKAEPLYAAALILDRAGRTGDAQAVAARIPEGQRTAEMRNFIAGLGISATIVQAKAAGARGAQGQGLAMLRQASEMRGISADRMGALAQGMLELGDARGASQLAAQALDAPANDAGAYDAAVRVLAQTGQDGLAMSAVQKASALAGPSLQGQRSLGNLKATLAAAQADRMRQAGQFAPAFDMLQVAWNDAPGNEEILSALARLYQSGGLNAQAAQTFRMLLAQRPSDRDAMVGLIDTASASGDMDTARAVSQQAIQMHPADYRVYMAAARMARTRGNDGDAARYLKTAKALYMRETGMAPDAVMANGNPFAAAPQSANPFRAMAAPQPVNPFALGSNPTAISAPYAPPMGFAPQQPAASPLPAAAAPAYPTAPGYAAPTGFPGMAAPAPSYGNPVYGNPVYGDPVYGVQGNGMTNVPADPVLAEIDQQLQQSADESGPRVDVDTGFRSRSGETGLSKLREMTGSASVSTPFAGGRVGVKATAVVLDAGRPTGSGLARFGTNATPEAQGIVDEQPSVLTNAETQHQSGVAVTASYVSKLLKLEAGVTPLGFPKEHVTGRIEVTPRLSTNATMRIWADRKPVTDSIIAYAGTEDPRTGAFWGAVMKSGGGLSLSYDRNGNGVYADGSFYHYDGTAVRDNDSVEINAGGYLRAWQNARSGVSVGFNVNYQNYDNNQNYFTYGHGGYFSPQSFLSVNFPVRYWTNDGPMSIQASVAPGYQSYDQQGEPVYPTEPGAQGVLDFLKSQNNDVRSRYDSISKTGFGLSATGAISYRVSPNTRLGGELNINTFGEYKEFKTLIGLKQNIGGN